MGETVTTEEGNSCPPSSRSAARSPWASSSAAAAFFSPAPCLPARDEVLAQLDATGHRRGDPAVRGDRQRRRAVASPTPSSTPHHFKAHRDRIDGLVICLPNFGDEIAVAELVNRARLNVPILLQASQRRGRQGLRSRAPRRLLRQDQRHQQLLAVRHPLHRDDLAHLRRWRRRTSAPTSTASPASAAPCAACAAPASAPSARAPAPSRRCATARSCCRPPASPSSPSTSREMMGAAGRHRATTTRRCSPSWSRIKAYGTIPAHITARPDRASRPSGPSPSTAGSRRTAATPPPSSAGARLQDNFGCATCVTMSMMGEELMPSACEVDIMGALSMYALALASGAPPAILDWNNNYGREPDMCVCTHCGNFPKILHRRHARDRRARRAGREHRPRRSASARSRAR